MSGTQGWDRARWLWWLALAGGISFMVAVVQRLEGPPIWAWKTTGVAFLALWAAANARGTHGWLIAAALGFGALGDYLIDAVGIMAGAAAFAIGHLIAITFYLRNRRGVLTSSQKLLIFSVAPLALFITYQIVHRAEPTDIIASMVYTGIVAIMAATAWASRFSRYVTGIGAMLFLASDLVLFKSMTPRIGPIVEALPPLSWPQLLVWPLYFGGQALIAWGVVSTLSREAGDR